MYSIEFEPTNIPAKIFFTPGMFEKWAKGVIFKGLVQDTLEGLITEALKVGSIADIKTMYFHHDGDHGKIAFKDSPIIQSISRHTLVQRIKQIVSNVKLPVSGEAQEKLSQEKLAKKIIKDRIAYAQKGIKAGITLHEKRIYARHFKLP